MSLPSSPVREESARGTRLGRNGDTCSVEACSRVKRCGAVAVPRVLALDVDGTLVGTGGRIGDRARRALRHVVRLGVRVVLASGRHPHAVGTLCRELGLSGFHICLNGALVIDPVSCALLVARFVSEREVRRAIDLFHREG